MATIYALTLLLCIYALGEVISVKTKGFIASVFAICVLMLLAFWGGMPKDIAVKSGINVLSRAAVIPMVVGIGTTMNFAELKRQWKTVTVSFIGVAIGVGIILTVGQMLLPDKAATASAPIFAGGAVALIIVNEALKDTNLVTALSSIVLTLYAVQKFFGIPISSFCLRKEARDFLQRPEQVKYYAAMDKAEVKVEEKSRPLSFFCKINKPSINLAKLAMVSCLSFYLGQLSHGKVHFLVIALFMGVIFAELGFLEKGSLGKTDSNFMIIFLAIMSVFTSLGNVTPQSLLASLVPVLTVLVLGSMGVVIASLVCSKLFHMSTYLCIALGITCTFGFPTTTLVADEAAELGNTAEEKKALQNYLLPQMTVAGFTTVTIGSVILAGFIVPLLK